MDAAPAFGQADLTNCERELIHLAGSVQPHGALLVLREADLVIVQASANAASVLGHDVAALLGQPLGAMGGDLAAKVSQLQRVADLTEPAPLQACVEGKGPPHPLEGHVHRHAGGALIVELEPVDAPADGQPSAHALPPAVLASTLSAAVQRFSAAPTVGTLADAVVQVFRELTGYDRVMVYKFDPDGHGKIIAEARHPRLESLLGHHYPATDIPQRARALYLRTRVRVLADVHYTAQPLVPELLPLTGQPLDMSLCSLRSMSPLHLQYLKNMGVTGTLVCSLVREGQLWGLVAAHHYEPRNLRLSMRAAAELLAEVASTRISAIENYAHAQVALMVRRLEQRLIEATSTEGDWRHALFRNPRTLLQQLEATGGALFHDGEVLTSGEVPSTPELRALLGWVDAQAGDGPFVCSAVGQTQPALDSLTPTASGVLAVRLSTSRPDFLMWFRKEQLLTVTWAGDPTKPMVTDNPLELSPRRSFAAWSEIVRGTAVPWSTTEVALARAIGVSLVGIIVQVQAVRLLIAEHQLAQVRAAVAVSREPVLVADATGRLIFGNDALAGLRGAQGAPPVGLAVAALFTQPQAVQQALDSLHGAPQGWRREWELDLATPLPVAVRAEIVFGRDGTALGFILTLADLREARRANAARVHLEEALREAARSGAVMGGPAREADEVISAILTNASLAAMDISEGRGGPPVAPLLEDLEASTRRATALFKQIRSFSS
jgi:light-regulated signal transduction histidine kinase (bacteriophytochrome)